MKHDDQPESQQAARGRRSIRAWLLGVGVVLLLLLMAASLLAPHFIDSAAVKRKIQATVAEQTGAHFDYQSIDFLFLPRPAIELHQVTLAMPDRIQGQVETLLLVPKLFPLLTGDLHLAAIDLTSPLFRLNLPAATAGGGAQGPAELAGPAKALIALIEPLRGVSPTLKLLISDGQLALQQEGRDLVEINGLKVQLGLLVIDPETAQATLHGSLSELTFPLGDSRETIKNARLDCSVKIAQGDVSFLLEHLNLAEPALELNGELVLAPQPAGSILQLHGKGINVDAIRRIALNLAADNQAVANIFRYLRGGRVPEISLHSRADSPGEFGALPNLHIEGQLQEGVVSIPQITLDLTEVNSEVILADGILQGTRISARLAGSHGHDGTLKVALGQTSDLFQLKLALSADLAEAQQILKRIVANQAFSEGLDKINDLKGSGRGTLVLGDSLSRINARLDVTDFQLEATYQGVPLPFAIVQGQLSFAEQQIDIKSMNGSIGHSELSDIAGKIAWEKALELDLRAGPAVLDIDELYPWLASQESLKKALDEISELSGQLELKTVNVKGAADQPGRWQISAAGSASKVRIATPRLPFPVNLAHGDFSLEPGSLAFENLQGNGLDADLLVSGRLEGFPQQVEQLELSLEGTLGADSAAWLRHAFDLPETYTLRSPLTLSATRILWQPDAATAMTGSVNVAQGPDLTFDLDFRAEQLHINQLAIRDQHSNARLVASLDENERSLSFSGALRHETLEALFVEPLVGQGEVTGEITISAPRNETAKIVAKGHLQGKNLQFPLASGDKITIEQVELDARGDSLEASATRINWAELSWQPFRATISFQPEKIAANITEAKLCGVDTPGLVTIAGKKLALDMTLAGKGLDVATSYSCLTQGRVKMTGKLDFTSKVSARGELPELLGSLKGPLEMTFAKGVIEEDKALARLLEVLNVTEVVKGRLPNLDVGGFPYTSITVLGEFKDGKLVVEKLAMDGETLDVLGHGKINLVKKKVDIELLAAPFKTIDTVIKNLPGVNYLLAGSLVSIPVSVKGDLLDPKVSVMSISSVGSSLLGLGERTLKAPIKLIETILPEGKDPKK
jgi:uncharacterized protein involved in outer membrane biogenesis